MREEVRAQALQAAIHKVVHGADGRAIGALLSGDASMDDLLASDLPGKWTVVHEEWQGIEGDLFVALCSYQEDDLVCIVDVMNSPEDDEPAVDAIWTTASMLRLLVSKL